MKKEPILFNKANVVSLIFCYMVFTIPISCSANTALRDVELSQRDSVVCRALGDSVYSIIVAPKTVRAFVSPKVERKDSLSQETKLDREEVAIAKFIVSDPQNYKSNTIVYGLFKTQFSLVFERKKERVNVHFDFGLRKWKVCNYKDEELAVFDLMSRDIVRFANILFPENEYVAEISSDTVLAE